MKLHKTIEKLSTALGRILPAQKMWKLCSLGEVVQPEGKEPCLLLSWCYFTGGHQAVSIAPGRGNMWERLVA